MIATLNRNVSTTTQAVEKHNIPADLAGNLQSSMEKTRGQISNAADLLTKLTLSQEDLTTKIGVLERKTDQNMSDLTAQLETANSYVARVAFDFSETAKSLTEHFPKQISDLGILVRQEFAKQVIRNRSWLASPYPKRLKVIPPNSAWERIRQGARFLGVRLAGPLAIQVVCEECAIPSKDKPYELDGIQVEFEEEAVRFYLHAGIAIGMIVIGPQLIPLHFVVHDADLISKLHNLGDRLPDTVKELGKDLAPELMAKIAFDRFKSTKHEPLSEPELDRTARGLFQTLRANTLTAINLGGNPHLHVGKLIEDGDSEDRRGRRPYGGLVRVLTKDETAYKWVCDECWAKHYRPLEQPSN